MIENWSTDTRQSLEKFGHPLKRASRKINNPYATTLTTALAWVSIGLGLAQILAPQQLSRTIGVGKHPSIMRSVGLREIIAGIGILASRAPSTWRWARTAGDAMDLALLGSAYKTDKRDGIRLGSTAALIAAIAVLDAYAALRQKDEEGP